jgi:hypothetical protein
MVYCIELPNVHHIVLILQDGRFVPVHIKVVWCRKNRNERGKESNSILLVHLVTGGGRRDTLRGGTRERHTEGGGQGRNTLRGGTRERHTERRDKGETH